MQIEKLNIPMAINEGSFQEYDYNQEYEECEWRVVYGTNFNSGGTLYVR